MFGTCARVSKIPTQTNRIEIGSVKVGLSRDEYTFLTELTLVAYESGQLCQLTSTHCNVYTLLALQLKASALKNKKTD